MTIPGAGGQVPPRPDQEYRGGGGVVIAPGSTNIVRALQVVIFGTGAGTGLFVYSGTPALGNPPIFWATSASADPFGNPISSTAGVAGAGQFTVGSAPSTQIQLVSVGGVGVLRFLLNDARFGNGILDSGIVGSAATVVLNGPANVAAGHTDFVGAEWNSSDGISSSANWELIYNDANGVAHTTAFGDFTGFGVAAGRMDAADPSSGTSPVNAAFPESWHAPTLPAGWGGGAAYKLYPDKTTGLAGTITLPSTGSYNNVTLFTLPAAYRPGGTKNVPISAFNFTATTISSTPRLSIDPTGVVQLHSIPAGANSQGVSIDGIRYPVDI